MQTKKNNFNNYQSDKISKRLTLIKEQIAVYKKKQVGFKNITELAVILSEHITKQEGASCSSSTILRNDKYKALIEDYFYSQPGIKKPGEASTLIAELSLSNVERENIRLKQYIISLEKELDEIRNNKAQKAIENKISYLSNEESNSANLKKALNILIKHFDGLVAINENGDLVDLTKKVNNVIVEYKLII